MCASDNLTYGWGALGISATYHVKDFHANRESRPQEGYAETNLQYETVQISKVGQTLPQNFLGIFLQIAVLSILRERT